MNAYDEACDRMEAARRGCQKARREAERILAAAEAEWQAADAALVACEAKPGIPLPEFRGEYHEHWEPGGQLVKHVHSAGRTPHEHALEATS